MMDPAEIHHSRLSACSTEAMVADSMPSGISIQASLCFIRIANLEGEAPSIFFLLFLISVFPAGAVRYPGPEAGDDPFQSLLPEKAQSVIILVLCLPVHTTPFPDRLSACVPFMDPLRPSGKSG